jgi:hypothetical protein
LTTFSRSPRIEKARCNDCSPVRINPTQITSGSSPSGSGDIAGEDVIAGEEVVIAVKDVANQPTVECWIFSSRQVGRRMFVE